jgi:hypothetical protein
MFTLSESKSTQTRLWLARIRAVAIGILFFFPAFALSLVLTVPWANHHWAGEAQSSLGAIGPSFWTGVVVALVCWIWRLKRVNREHGTDQPQRRNV